MSNTQQLNDLTTKSKDLRYISDVDQSIDDFEERLDKI
jgi:hypothetical protein